eukprot:tig00020876_g14846.t1
MRAFLIAKFVAVTCLLLLLALAFFRPTVASVQREKQAALALFRDIPHAAIRELAASHRRRAVQEELEAEGSDDELLFDHELDDLAEAPGSAHRGGGGGAGAGAGLRSRLCDERRAPRTGRSGSGDKEGGEAEPGRVAAPSAAAAALRRARRRLLRAWRVVVRRLGSPDRVTVMYTAAFLCLFFVFLAWFVVGMDTAYNCESFSSERNFAGALRSLPAKLHYHAREMATNPGDYARQRALLARTVDMIHTFHRGLLFGDASLHLPGALHRYASADELLFGPACLAAAPADCAPAAPNAALLRVGLEKMLARLVEEARLLLTTPPERLGPADEHLAYMEAVGASALQPSLQRLADLFVEEADLRLRQFAAAQAACFAAVCVLLLFEYLLVFRRIVSGLNDEARRTVFMFLMLPAEVIEATESIKTHLARLVASVAAGDEL